LVILVLSLGKRRADLFTDGKLMHGLLNWTGFLLEGELSLLEGILIHQPGFRNLRRTSHELLPDVLLVVALW
jgi:hypothetical protein